jgi:hypothetical protein
MRLALLNPLIDLQEKTMNRIYTKSGALLTTVFVAVLLALGPSIAQSDRHGGEHGMQADDKGMHGGGMHSDDKGMHGGGKGMHGGGKGMHGGGMHGGGKGMHGQGHGKKGGHHLYGQHWRETLTDDQEDQLDRLHVAYAKNKAPRKAMMKALKVELTVLATATERDKEAINAGIEELLEIKAEALRAKYAYISAQRQVLTPKQQVSFDMDMIHKAMHGKKGKGHH